MTPDFDIAICGAGPVGLALAASLARRGMPAARIALIDAKPLEQAAQDPRSIALSWGSRQLLEESGLDPNLATTHAFYEGVGCIECNGTGYKGRMAICELLDLTDRIREMILARRPTSEIKKAARDEGMRFLRECAVERVMEGTTTLREINKVTFVE